MDKGFVLDALLRFNYFPIQRREREEIPPALNSEEFTAEIAKNVSEGHVRSKGGYDAVEYRLTRFNGVPRPLSIPHPAAQAKLALSIHTHWEKLAPLTKSPQSHIRPRQHDDGRCIVMDYEKAWEKAETFLRRGFAKRFIVHTDVANFFPSIYSHSIPWAAIGFSEAKKKKGKKHASEWFNELDAAVRQTKRDETQGIPIGPATSNIFAELVLGRIDAQLQNVAPHVRYIDDFRAFCDSEDQAQEFVRCLSEELAKYKLVLNARKTEILHMPQPASPAWLSQLALALPRDDKISGFDAVNYLNLAVALSASATEGSVIKYALKSLAKKNIASLGVLEVIPFALNLAFHNPVLLPLLGMLFKSAGFFMLFWKDELLRVTKEHARLRRSDGAAWGLYWMAKYHVNTDQELRTLVLKSRDCVPMLMLYAIGSAEDKQAVLAFAKSLDAGDCYELDQYWLLLYLLFAEGALNSPYKNEDTFQILRDSGVSFLKPVDSW